MPSWILRIGMVNKSRVVRVFEFIYVSEKYFEYYGFKLAFIKMLVLGFKLVL